MHADLATNADKVLRLVTVHDSLCALDHSGVHIGVAAAVALRLGGVLAAHTASEERVRGRNGDGGRVRTAVQVLRQGLMQVERHRQRNCDRAGACNGEYGC